MVFGGGEREPLCSLHSLRDHVQSSADELSARQRRCRCVLRAAHSGREAPRGGADGDQKIRYDTFAMCDCIIYIDLMGKITTRI